jgi:hypothetical protein
LPGISEKDIVDASKFGEVILPALLVNNFDKLQSQLLVVDAVRVSPFLVLADKTGNKIFAKWSNFIIKRDSSRKSWLKVFKIYLLVAIYLISPIVYILHLLLYPININKIKQQTLYYKGL